MAPRRRALEDAVPEKYAGAGRGPHRARRMGGRRRERARDVQGRGAARGHPAVPHRVGGAQRQAGRRTVVRPSPLPRGRL
ncbi:hypothetical protein BH78_01810 [Pseudomonas aeruginosa C1913C]|nr:hypothetical protein Z695_0111460 [Pseudomonas aeruginosa SG17M]KEA22716.1 hypothetical protein BH78_01810 [Pseudomonas aeruginosa C1913C]